MSSTPNLGELAEWGLEIDFLVAKEKNGSASWRGEEKDYRWSCPEFEPKPQEACAKCCAEMVQKYALRQQLAKGGVGYCDRVASPNEKNFTVLESASKRHALPPSMCTWLFSASPTAVSLPTSPQKLDWVGIKVRSPFKPLLDVMPSGLPYTPSSASLESTESSWPETDPSLPPSPAPDTWARLEIENVLGVLRNSVKMHVNSTCQVRIHYTLRREGFDLVEAKKMLTLCWMMEPELLLKLRTGVRDPKRNHFLPITTSSKIAKVPTKFRKGYMEETPDDCERLLGQTRPIAAPEADEMDQYIPNFNDSHLQERIQAIWGANSLSELADLITSPDGETTIAIHVPGAKLSPTMEFRYAVWHPHKEAMGHWLRLLGRLFFYSMGSSSEEFKEMIADIEVRLLECKKCEVQDRWKTLLAYQFDSTMCYFWETSFKNEELPGKSLSPENLDSQGILDRVSGVACVSIVDSESNSDSTSDSYSSTSS
ncbi:hypothetical protein G7Z17_g6616 [Cylindrodendrum hubeiense]|uniref:Uncharacterized protein n=1 Tax=Cylindrodendrum hubeiense TaxID=595255 RepID=A0A9P5H705_9HYPO|nr:hypothetical protein G7Z17_g6616 [Cylindrodendrum hubeiense]